MIHWPQPANGPGREKRDNRDIDAIGQILNTQPDPTLDARPVIGRQAAGQLHLDDGLHLSLAGQQALAVALVDTFTDQS
ncbi:hypothetical protein GCM10023322_75710 [Rugosimonospora acidiphila]|uniref:SGNH hydrolase-type esterase domain-containing protein n=1 Tax=Rugosimonospora acidiphila TaxID=556531 RepID=A0ABP9SNF0_9ACTN